MIWVPVGRLVMGVIVGGACVVDGTGVGIIVGTMVDLGEKPVHPQIAATMRMIIMGAMRFLRDMVVHLRC